jgi:hypothetical protein
LKDGNNTNEESGENKDELPNKGPSKEPAIAIRGRKGDRKTEPKTE